MDVAFFLKERTKFIQAYYETASGSFRETIRKIEAEEPPFEPPYSEDSEPAFLTEWLEASTALEVLGRSCISMLSESLKLYLVTWERILWQKRPCGEHFSKVFKQGFLHGYMACFGEALSITWAECPADISILDQVVLARNRDQHPESISTFRVNHDRRTRGKYASPFFMDERERAQLQDLHGEASDWLDPTLHVSRDGFLTAVAQVELFVDWFETLAQTARYPNRA
jgi:hypothetical protein